MSDIQVQHVKICRLRGGEIRLLFAYNRLMEIAGYRREPDLSKIGPTLIIASSLILAIRTASWPRIKLETLPNRDWDAEQSVRMAHIILSHLLTKSPFLFPHKDVPWDEPSRDK